MGLPLIALALVTAVMLWVAWAIRRTHAHAEPRVVWIRIQPPTMDHTAVDDGLPLPPSPRSYEDPPTAALHRAPFPKYFAQRAITRGGEWR